MTLLEMKKKVLGLIEELNPENELLTDDPDIQAKINDVINQIMFELARMKKIPKYIEIEVDEGEIIDFARIAEECGSEVYQIERAKGIQNDMLAQGTVIKAQEKGTLCIEFLVYPESITADTSAEGYEFELSADVLEIMPYGVAADLLKSDESAAYGNVYSVRYENMKNELDPRYILTSYTVEGGVYI